VGDALYASGDYEKALAQYEKVPPDAKEAPGAANRAALALIGLRRLHDAEQKLSQIVAAGRGNDATRAILGAVYLRQYRFEQARAEVAGPAQRGSLSGLLVGAYADLARRNFDRCIAALKRVAARAPTAEPEFLAACLFTDGRDMKRATAAAF